MSRATQENTFLMTARILARFRYRPAPPTSSAQPPVLDRYLQALDPDHVLFTRSDIARFEPQRELLARSDDSKQLGTAFALFEQMRARRTAMWSWTGEALRGPLSALEGNRPPPQAGEPSWPASDQEQQALWRQQVADELGNLRSAGFSDKEIVAILIHRNDDRLARVRALTMDDAFEAFMNAYVGAFDPHGIYLPPVRSVVAPKAQPGHVGVGLVLKKRGEWVTVQDLIGGGAAWRSGQLNIGDRIVGVAQGTAQPMTDVAGWGVDEVVAALRGLPNSTVVLDVSPANAQAGSPARRVMLVRDTGSSLNNAGHATAKLEVLDRGGASYRIAVVTIPSFYEDFVAKRAGVSDYASMTREVTGLMAKMKAQGANAVLLDMRRNGGGWLAEAISFAGLFLPRAAIAQQREPDGKIKLESAPDTDPAWEGPLAVLIDEGSAAATEIFAAAIQDHGRGLVIGDRSFGRSSVQARLPLDRFATNPSEHYGELMMTVAQVYRVSGESFEQTGVTPDIPIPGLPKLSDTAHQLAFPAAPISPAAYKPSGEIKAVMPALSRRHEARTTADTSYQTTLHARSQPSDNKGATRDDILRVQLREALQVVVDEVELLRSSPRSAQ
ncbi:MAG: S41 family peptidase [Gammaproteobacteria bacterium]